MTASSPVDGAQGTELSIVVPLFNEAEVFGELTRRLNDALSRLPPTTEVLLVNDGSTDTTGALISQCCRVNPAFVGIHLSRNFGHQLAVAAGLDLARGDAVAVMDGNLQDPPEILPEFLTKLREGYDVVYAVRRDRKENAVLRFLYWLFYRLMAALTPLAIPVDSGDFGMMSRRVVDALKAMPERRRFVRGMRSYVGFRQTGLAYERHERAGGRSKYTFFTLLTLAADGIFTFSEVPLRLVTIAGFCAAGLSLIYASYLFVWRVLGGANLPGFATLGVGLFFLGGVQLISMGILGEYIGRIHHEVKQRPSFIVERVEGRNV